MFILSYSYRVDGGKYQLLGHLLDGRYNLERDTPLLPEYRTPEEICLKIKNSMKIAQKKVCYTIMEDILILHHNVVIRVYDSVLVLNQPLRRWAIRRLKFSLLCTTLRMT